MVYHFFLKAKKKKAKRTNSVIGDGIEKKV
jgi:hypothetical protein